jgi:hypothetical protein
MAVAADDQTTGKAGAKLGSDDMDDTLTGLVDVQQMTIDAKEVCIIADSSDDMLVPDLGRHRTAGLF